MIIENEITLKKVYSVVFKISLTKDHSVLYMHLSQQLHWCLQSTAPVAQLVSVC